MKKGDNMDKLQEIKNESLRDGKGVIVHKDNFDWLIEEIDRLRTIEKAYYATQKASNHTRN